mgnify:CR=1 FL=1
MTTGTVDGLSYELHGGPVAGRQVVLLSSGLGGSGAFWAPQMAALTERWPVVTYDHRGTGRSVRTLPPGPYAVQDMADDMVRVLDALGLAGDRPRAQRRGQAQGPQDAPCPRPGPHPRRDLHGQDGLAEQPLRPA